MIVCSHRGPYTFEQTDAGAFVGHRGAGGLVSALSPLLASTTDAIWVAAAMSDDDRAAARAGAPEMLDDVNLHLLDLDPALHRMHYEVVSNAVLWFMHHGIFDHTRRPRFDIHFHDAWDAYVAVNRSFATEVAKRARERDVVLVQDYQLSLVPGQLVALRPDLRVVHFTHTPFAGPEEIRVLPDNVAQALCGSLAAVPAGFHTTRWSQNYQLSTRVVLPDHAIAPSFAASLGPDAPALEAQAASRATREAGDMLSDAVGDRLVITRSDRIEPSKNIVRGFLAFDRLLEARHGLRGRVVFVARLYRSRQGLSEYLAYGNEVEQVVARVNDRWATRDWTPILMDDRDDFARSVAAMRRYDVLFVNPLRDGLNLVAKEGPIVNTRDGVLVLSPQAGAWEELRDAAISVHSYDIEQAAGALDHALSMPLDARAARATKLRALASARTPSDWLADLVRHAGE